jgi:hypothetical protein
MAVDMVEVARLEFNPRARQTHQLTRSHQSLKGNLLRKSVLKGRAVMGTDSRSTPSLPLLVRLYGASASQYLAGAQHRYKTLHLSPLLFPFPFPSLMRSSFHISVLYRDRHGANVIRRTKGKHSSIDRSNRKQEAKEDTRQRRT